MRRSRLCGFDDRIMFGLSASGSDKGVIRDLGSWKGLKWGEGGGVFCALMHLDCKDHTHCKDG